jgi:hypothetical protein
MKVYNKSPSDNVAALAETHIRIQLPEIDLNIEKNLLNDKDWIT